MESQSTKSLATLGEIARIKTHGDAACDPETGGGTASLQVRLAALLTSWGMRAQSEARACLRDEEGQGTTEYAILVGVLVVIAIAAIIAFRGKIQELWTAITSGINSL